MRRKLELVSFRAVLYAVLARMRKLIACVRAPAQLLRLVLSFLRAASSWLSSPGSPRPALPTAQQSHGQAEDTELLQEPMTSLNIVCASHVPDSHILEAVPDIGSMRDPAAAASASIATSSHDNHTHADSQRNGVIVVPSSLYAAGQPGSSSQNVAVPAASSHSVVSQATSTSNLPATALTTGIRPAGPRSRSFASRALEGRPSSSGAPHQPSVTLAIPDHLSVDGNSTGALVTAHIEDASINPSHLDVEVVTVPFDSEDQLPLPECTSAHEKRPPSTSPSVHHVPDQHMPHAQNNVGYGASSPELYDVLSATTAVQNDIHPPPHMVLPPEREGPCRGCAIDSLRPERIIPSSADWIYDQRYEMTPQISREGTREKIPPMTRCFPGTENDLKGWEPLMHPEGALYFYHPHTRTYTTTNLYNEESLSAIEPFLALLQDAKREHTEELPEDTETAIYMVIDETGKEFECLYYLIDHGQRVTFWLNEYDASSLLHTVEGASELSHIRWALEEQYWLHWEMFPAYHDVSPRIYQDLKGMIIHGAYDTLSSEFSTIIFDAAELMQWLTLIQHVQEVGNVGGYAAAVVGRMMSIFASERFGHFAGQPCARLGNNQTVYKTDQTEGEDVLYPSLLMTLCSPLLYFAPDAYLRNLRERWTDQWINRRPWKILMTRVQEEWRDYVTLSTILLASNTALLAVPDVDSSFVVDRNPVQILSYFSILTSIGSIVVGLLLLRHYHYRSRGTATEVATYLDSTDSTRGREKLAIIWSLPYAGLMWGMCTFLASLSALFFRSTSLLTRLLTGGVEVVVVVFILWTIGHTWDEGFWLESVVKLAQNGWTKSTRMCINSWTRLHPRLKCLHQDATVEPTDNVGLETLGVTHTEPV